MTKLLFAQISVALSIVTVLLLFYGAYLFDIGVISNPLYLRLFPYYFLDPFTAPGGRNDNETHSSN